jgi:signal peptidase I
MAASSSSSHPATAERPSADPIALILSGLAKFGAVTVEVSGDSMLPTLPPGRVMLHAVGRGAIRPQDVIAFRSHDGRLVLHRVHVISSDQLITAGDGQTLFDPPVPMADVVGVVRGLPARPEPRPWPAGSGPAAVDVWLIGGNGGADIPWSGHPSTPRDAVLPAQWRLHRRPAEGVGVSAAVLEELRAAVHARPCIGVTERAVHAAADVLTGSLPPQTQVLVGCAFGRLCYPMPGNLVPTDFADVYVRLGPPGVPLSAAETLHRLVALVASGKTGPGGPP